jgi:hypothetical protein
MKKQSNRWPLFVRGSMLVVWMGVIFLFSSMPGSGSLYDPPTWYVLERKGAHVFEFAFLSVFAFRFFRVLFDATWRMTAAIRQHSFLHTGHSMNCIRHLSLVEEAVFPMSVSMFWVR